MYFCTRCGIFIFLIRENYGRVYAFPLLIFYGRKSCMERFRKVGLGDREILESLILSLEPCSCEMNFLNIYTWQEAYDTHWCIWDGFPVIWFKNENLLLFPGGILPEKMPPVSLLKEIAMALHGSGFPVTVNQVPSVYLEQFPE